MKKILLLFIFCSFTKMTFAQSKNQVSVGAKYYWYSLTNSIASNPYSFSVDYFRSINEKSAVGLEIEAIFPHRFDFISKTTNTKLTLNYRRYPIRKERVKFFYEGGISIRRSVIISSGLTYSQLSGNSQNQSVSNKKYIDYGFPYFNLKIGGEIKVFKNFTVLPKVMCQFSENYTFFSPVLGIGYTF